MPQGFVYVRTGDWAQWLESDKARIVREGLARERQLRVERLKGSEPLLDQPGHIKPLITAPVAPAPAVEHIDETPAEDGPLFAVIVEATGTVIKKDLTFLEADEWLLKLNKEGDMVVREQPK